MNNDNNNEIKEKILKLLEGNSEGLTIQEVAESLNINRVTSSKYLSVLVAEGKVRVREVGNARLHYPKEEEEIS